MPRGQTREYKVHQTGEAARADAGDDPVYHIKVNGNGYYLRAGSLQSAAYQVVKHLGGIVERAEETPREKLAAKVRAMSQEEKDALRALLG